MKTSQSFPFYPSDFILGTMLMNAEEVGAYIRLLCFQWEQGAVPTDESKVSRIAGVAFKKLNEVLGKFDVIDGGYRNARLERVRSEREAYQKRQSDLGKKGGRPKANPSDFKKGSESQPFLKTEAKSKPPSPSPSPSPSPRETPLPPPTPPASPSSGEEVLLFDPAEAKGVGEGKANPDIPSTTQSKRIAVIFRRRLTTAWTKPEISAYKKLGTIPEDDLAAVERYYSELWPPEREKNILRHDLVTFLRNFQGEVDRAHSYSRKAAKEPVKRESEFSSTTIKRL